ncbi:MAG: amidase [Xanthomonadales bacterium]|jgi:amidase|nr:amidase [Xanthomonadales bacterium]
MKRLFLFALFAVLTGCAATPGAPPEVATGGLHGGASGDRPPAFDPATADATTLAAELVAGRLSAEEVTRTYLARIAAIDDAGPRLNAIIEINPDALAIAEALDRRLTESGPAGPLHGLPVVLKANIDTGDRMATSAGSLALAEHRAGDDAFLVRRLRDAGAVIIAKANLSEWANFRDSDSSSGWSSLGGQTRNPHVLDRNPCGSSSGSAVAVAAGLAPLAVGTETNGSIVCPAGASGIVGIKPTLGTVSRDGIIPIAHSQDTAGPMATTVADAALLLQTLVAMDPNDPGARAHPASNRSFAPAQGASLEGRRIGIYRSYFGAGQRPRTEAVFDAAVALLEGQGAVLVDPIERTAPEGAGAAQYTVLTTEFKHDLDAYLSAAGLPPDRDSLEDLVAWNEANADAVMPIFGQSIFHDSLATEGLDSEAYREARALNNERMLADVEALLQKHDLDALFVPVNGPAWKTDWLEGDRFSFGGTSSLAAISGLPSIVLPAGVVEGLPVNVGFVGAAFSEPLLIDMAQALETALPPRPLPAYRTSLELAPEE